MARMKRWARLAGMIAATLGPAAASYHYVHYLNSSSPYQLAFEKFDLTALPDKTVTFFVSNTGPTSYAANDSFPSVLEQFRNATQVWNSVASSDLRVGFGGLQVAGTPQSVPTGEVVFEDLPPGVLAYAGHQVAASGLATAADGTQFVPITLSLIHLNVNLTQQAGQASTEGYTGPSYSELFFTVLLHEIGHAIGLQHTYTSSTMSTAVSRATNRAHPLDVDDVSGVSALYPRGGYPAGFGSISGQVTMGGNGVHLASVVALLPNGAAVSSLTNPDGSYEIDGLVPGNYWVYVHPLPPTANITLPLDADGNPVQASGAFVSTFYPGPAVWDPSQFTVVPIGQGTGANQANINFQVTPRAAVEVYDVTSYWYGTSYLQPAYLNANTASQTVEAQGTGITSTDNPVQTVWALGASGGPLPDYGLSVYQDVDVALLAAYFDSPAPPLAGPEHLLFNLPDDIFVLPGGIQVVQNAPPVVTAVTPNADGSVTVAGTGFNTASQVFFDSLPAQVTVAYAADATDSSGQSGTISVMPPPGASGQIATITVYNLDGQNSTFLLPVTQSPFTYAYPQTSAPAAAISISQLAQGQTAMITVGTTNMQFVAGMTTLGFGSGDVTVRQLWVVSPTKALANVTVSPNALLRETVASVISGFQVYDQPLGFQVVAANPNMPTLTLPVQNGVYPEQNSLYPGTTAILFGQNLQAAAETPNVSVGGVPAQVLYSSATQIYFVIPASVTPGPRVMTFQGALPVVLQIDSPPPSIVSAASASGQALSAVQTAAPGDTITLEVSGIASAVLATPGRVGVIEGGVSIPVFTMQQAQDGTNNVWIQFALAASVTGQELPVAVTLDGDLSMPFYITVVGR